MPLKRELFDSFLTLLCRTSGRLAPAIGEVGSTRARYATLLCSIDCNALLSRGLANAFRIKSGRDEPEPEILFGSSACSRPLFHTLLPAL